MRMGQTDRRSWLEHHVGRMAPTSYPGTQQTAICDLVLSWVTGVCCGEHGSNFHTLGRYKDNLGLCVEQGHRTPHHTRTRLDVSRTILPATVDGRLLAAPFPWTSAMRFC